jgi:hypothetical protein
MIINKKSKSPLKKDNDLTKDAKINIGLNRIKNKKIYTDIDKKPKNFKIIKNNLVNTTANNTNNIHKREKFNKKFTKQLVDSYCDLVDNKTKI